MSWVFVGQDEAFKLKKAVRHPYLDFSTLERREFFCREELRLNARLAPGVYLGLAALLWDGCTLALRRQAQLGSADAERWQVLDWLVRMRRLPEDHMLHRLIAGGAVGPAAMRALADVLVAFYRAAPALPLRGPDYAAQLARECAAHAAVLEHARVAAVAEGGGIAAAAADAIARLACALDRHAPALHARAEAGRIVEGHGDLRPEHVCFPRVNATAAAASATAAASAAAAAPVIIDALEFNAELRRVDPLDELAYLGLECEAAGARWIGPWLAREYAAALEPAGVPPLLPPLYAAHRAMLRARLCAAHLLDEPPPPAPQAAQWLMRSRRYLELAQGALRSLQAIEAEAGTT